MSILFKSLKRHSQDNTASQNGPQVTPTSETPKKGRKSVTFNTTPSYRYHQSQQAPKQVPQQPQSCNNTQTSGRIYAASSTRFFYMTALCGLIAICLASVCIQETEARVNIIAPTPPNQFYLNEFCDLHSKAPINRNKQKPSDRETQLFLNNKNQFSSMRVQPETRRRGQPATAAPPTQAPAQQQQPATDVQAKPRAPANGIAFGFNATDSHSPIIKQLNCFFVVVAPKSHGLLMNVNSIGLPKNQTQLTITLNHESNHSQLIHLEGEEKPSQYLLTQDGNSKIAIHLQSFQPIDWSHISFDILFTVYKKANHAGCPNKRWFDCGDNICVPASLVCDKTPNCPNGNDEMIFFKCYSSLFWSMAVTCALVLILVITISAVLFICRRRQGRLNRLNSLSDDVLTADVADNLSAKLDLNNGTLDSGRSQSYLKSNLFFNGFENPVWTNNSAAQPGQNNKSNSNIINHHLLEQHHIINETHRHHLRHTLRPKSTVSKAASKLQHRPSLVDGPHLGLDLGVASASGAHR